MLNNSIYYASGRLSMLERDVIGQAKLDRLLQSNDVSEARKILLEYGWPDLGDDEKNALENFKSACDIVNKLSVNKDLVDCFLTRYDIANLKILIKSKYVDEEPASLSPCGIVDVERLKSAVSEQKYDIFPKEISSTLILLDKKLVFEINPAQIDILLDKAYYSFALSKLPKQFILTKRFFKIKVDTLNFSMLLRLSRLSKNWAESKEYIIENGSIPILKWEKSYIKNEQLAVLLSSMPPQIYSAAIAAQISFSKLAAFEKVCDDYLFGLYSPLKSTMDKDERLIYFLLLKERETACVRLVLAAKENNFSIEDIKERLRKIYVR